MPTDLLCDVLYRLFRRHHESLTIDWADFCCLRVGERTCGSNHRGGGWSTKFLNLNGDEVCADERCGAHIFVRYHSGNPFRLESCLPSNCVRKVNDFSGRPVPTRRMPITSTAFVNPEPTSSEKHSAAEQGGQSHQSLQPNGQIVVQVENPPGTSAVQETSSTASPLPTAGQLTRERALSGAKSDTHWLGRRVGHTVHCVQLADETDGISVWWWNAIMSASSLVVNPKLVRLQSKRQVLNALSLLCDIIRLGDFILEYRRPLFQWLLDDPEGGLGTRRGLFSTPAALCNIIIRKIPLQEWSDLPKSFPPDFQFPRNRDDGYALLFYIIAERSKLFTLNWAGVQKESSANFVIENVLKAECKNRMEFNTMATALVDEWLSCWGLGPSIEKFNEHKSNARSAPNTPVRL